MPGRKYDRQPDAPAVVITGSTRGLGFAMAQEFLSRGCRVTVSGRGREAVCEALGRLAPYGDHAAGQACDVAEPAQVQTLWREAVKRWGRVDIWVNNAGIAQDSVPVWEIDAREVERLLRTNVLGVVHGSAVAMQGMRGQGGQATVRAADGAIDGAIYNMEGWGSDGKHRNGLTLYGTSKCALRYFTRGLAEEAAAQAAAGGSRVLVGTLSPGMMVTDFLRVPMQRMAAAGPSYDPRSAERLRRVVNILGDHPETVARFLVGRILANRRQRAHFAWLTGSKATWRFLTAVFRRRDLGLDGGGSATVESTPGEGR